MCLRSPGLKREIKYVKQGWQWPQWAFVIKMGSLKPKARGQ